MSEDRTIVIVLAAGLGTRMGAKLPKVLHPLAGRPMLSHLFETLSTILPERTILVNGPDMEEVNHLVSKHGLDPEIVIQKDRLGTGHALITAKRELQGNDGTVLVVYGDTPLLTAGTMKALISARQTSPAPAVVVLGFKPDEAGDYGRLILDNDGNLERIVEAREASSDQLNTSFCNSGVMAIDAKVLPALLEQINNDNSKGEYYLTDIVKIAVSQGRLCSVIEGNEQELIGINSKIDLAEAESILQQRLRHAAMRDGTTLIDPSTVYFSWDTNLGSNVTVGPNVYFGPGVTIEDDVYIHSFSHLEGAKVASGAVIGPFARLRPGADIGSNARIGNFVEVKNSAISDGVKANHLSYIGDAKIGQNANLGAGTITCNYDGQKKLATEVGEEAFIGSNTALVAPVKIGKGAVIGAGSVITKDVEDEALAVTRSNQNVVPGWAKSRRRPAGDN